MSYYVGNSGKEVGCYHYHSGCDQAHLCGNNRCYWRRRDVFGASPWAIPDHFPKEQQEQQRLSEELKEKYGETIFPEIKCSQGTNVWTMYCEDFIPLEELLKKK